MTFIPHLKFDVILKMTFSQIVTNLRLVTNYENVLEEFQMKKANLYIPELRSSFSGRSFFRKSELRDFYRRQSEEISEKAFRRILYALKNQNHIQQIDAGIYTLGFGQTAPRSQKKFIPTFSSDLNEFNHSIQALFPYLDYLVWETRILHEFMLHQPGQNQIILETEKETNESVFNTLKDRYPGKVFLQPDRKIFERYILPQKDSIIIAALITQSPRHKVNGIPCPKIEKILVDVFADDEKFYVFHGQELVHIFETAFERYLISEKALFRYAERRKVGKNIRSFIHRETNIQLLQQREVG